MLSEEMGVDILTVCNGCFGSLADANNRLKENPELRNEVNKALAEIGREFKGTIRVCHIMEYLQDDIGVRKVKEAVRYPVDLKVAVHYGCHLIKPSKERHLGSVENPRFFDELVEATGATSVPYKDKNACCGAGGGVRTADLDTSLLFTRAKLEHARDAGADCIVDSCPFCHLQMYAGQIDIEKKFGDIFNNGSPRAIHRHHRPQERGVMPIIHYSQLLGLGMGYTPQELGIDMNYVRNDEFIRTIEKIA